MRIVVVEDEAPIREGMVKLLSKINADYEVVGKAEDGEKGYQIIKELEPDLVIMDIRMPKMDGLKMLKKLRDEQVKCRAIVLSAYSDFEYAQEAISLKIENYLLKPIKIPELKRALKQVEESISQEKDEKQMLSLENVILTCMHGQQNNLEQLNDEVIKEKYGISINEPAEFFVLWLGDGYDKQKEEARELLESVANHSMEFQSSVLEYESGKLLLMVIFSNSDKKSQKEYFQKSVVPMLSSHLGKDVIYLWGCADTLLKMPDVLEEMKIQREWNLVVPPATLISSELIEAQHPTILKYQMEIEEAAKYAVRMGNQKELEDSFRKLYEYYKEESYSPADVKKLIIHLCWVVFHTYKEQTHEENDLEVQGVLQRIAEAVVWKQIKLAISDFLQLFNYSQEDTEDSSSTLVKKAKQLIRKYYSQGITLEEIADKLYVSEEYLSAQFKKETGATFSETIRSYRIEKIKELLLTTHLKLNQIAELTGYSDPKYMSKVFKEEVGMLPNEFRKSIH